jgi:hypothetical protein
VSNAGARRSRSLALAGLMAGAGAWYAAHDLSFYWSGNNCQHGWIAPTIHGIALIVCLCGGALSARTFRRTEPSMGPQYFLALLGSLGGLLFTLVILWQGVATLVYTGCER